ncbi:hypothetical protein HC761_00725 [bacterium]|nr:hypothetical protein [bacterium]
MKINVQNYFTRDVTFSLPQGASAISLVATVDFSIDPDLSARTDEAAYASAVLGIRDVTQDGKSILEFESPMTPKQIKEALAPKMQSKDGEEPSSGIGAFLAPACSQFWRENRQAVTSGNSKP